ncbi:putative plastidic glucose transporter 2 [Sesamum angolense]|uniref:Plastidic glucose transporter 2 n=1 Tax=Sesamum angolense TaxID=2727404 RepID=A0AAE1WE41_9LAMI|nr:putative plastidic glucose transporter 2 [Sesamum angolense]
MFENLHGSSMHKRTMISRDYNYSTDVEDSSELIKRISEQETASPLWKLSLPHVLVATIVSFLFGYHLGVVNEPLESISVDLGLVVSTCLAGAFIGSLISGWIADEVGRRRAFQLCALPMIIVQLLEVWWDASGEVSSWYWFGRGSPVASLYVTEISPAHVRGTYGSFIQIATCLGLMGAFSNGIPVRSVFGWWRICFWVSTIPAALLALLMRFCAESPHWLYKQGRIAEAEAQLERLLGGSHVTAAMVELSKTDTGDEMDTIKLTDLLYGRHARGVQKFIGFIYLEFLHCFIGSTLFALQQLSGINAVFYFSSTVFRRAGVSSNLGNVLVGIANLIGSTIALALMDKLGRKVLLLWSFFGMAISMALQVLASALFASSPNAFYLSIGACYCLSYCLLLELVQYLLSYSLRYFQAVLGLKLWRFVLNFLVGLLFLRLLDQMGPELLYSMFGTFCILAVVFVKRNVLETKGKSLQEIEIALLPQE